MINSFAIFKNDNAEGNQPQYIMVGKPADAPEGQKSNTLASLWLKEKNGQKFYSGKMKDEFVKNDGTKYDGYVIISLAEYNKLKGQTDINSDEIPF
jgi:hypothetical protein